MQLADLLRALPDVQSDDGWDIAITGLAYDSRLAQPGWLFVAIRGTHVDGHAYLADAAARGAVAAVGEEAIPAVPAGLRYIQTANSRLALALLACRFYGYPAHCLGVIGVTGTDGKTTTTNLIGAILDAAGQRNGLISTVNFKVGATSWENATRQSTPESLDIQRMLAEMVANGARYAVIETTSHALVLDRVVGCEYDVAAVTNITHEHLDFHGTLDAYRRAKARLFAMVDPENRKDPPVPRAAVLNADDTSYAFLRPFCRVPVLSYGIEQPADIRADHLDLASDGSAFRVCMPDGEMAIETKLVGRFNVANCLAAIGVAYALGVAPEAMRRALAAVTGVPGRMERIDCGQPFQVIVDYAHTPDSLEKVLAILRPLTPGRLMVVFGSAGERDVQKRPIMGAIAARYADFFVITDEDPREEDREAILEEIAMGATSAGAVRERDYLCIADRRAAIAAAFARARPGDTVLLAGKGHEQCIIMGREKVPWDDRRVARELLAL